MSTKVCKFFSSIVISLETKASISTHGKSKTITLPKECRKDRERWRKQRNGMTHSWS
jgi:hypothetical protein